MKNLKWVILFFLIAFALGFITGRMVYKCAPLVPFSSDTTVTDTTIWTWDYPEYSDTTVAATITYEEVYAGDDPEPSTGRIASTQIKYSDGDILDIAYKYDEEVFDVVFSRGPRSIQTHFITREIKEYIPIPRAKWDKPEITFGAGCLTGSVITIIVVKLAIGALQ